MTGALMVILPIFALVLVGWIAGRAGVLGQDATAVINRFVVWLALPALLFNFIATAHWSQLWQPGFIATFVCSGLIASALAALVAYRRRGNLIDSTIDGLSASYANIGFIGFPLALATLGQEAMVMVTIASILTMCTLFALTIVIVEVLLQEQAHPAQLAKKVALTLIRNPILAASLVATIFPTLEIALPAPAARFLSLLSNAATPCALVALGLFLSARRSKDPSQQGLAPFLIIIKLVLHPALTWLLAHYVFGLTGFATRVIVLLAAIPAGTGSFMLAEFYGRKPQVASDVIIGSTLLSIVTLAVCITITA